MRITLLGVTIITDSVCWCRCNQYHLFYTPGLEDGMKLIENRKGAEAVFITEDFTLHKSSGIGSEIPFHEN